MIKGIFRQAEPDSASHKQLKFSSKFLAYVIEIEVTII